MPTRSLPVRFSAFFANLGNEIEEMVLSLVDDLTGPNMASVPGSGVCL